MDPYIEDEHVVIYHGDCAEVLPQLSAARMLGRKAIGIEVNERYCEVMARRFDQVLPVGDTSDTSTIGGFARLSA